MLYIVLLIKKSMENPKRLGYGQEVPYISSSVQEVPLFLPK